MDFKQLNYFVAVAQELSFSRAAIKLHMSQPPLSQQIKLLEEDLGVLLFNRTRRSVELTHAGTLFYERAINILEDYATAKELCSWTSDGRAGKLRIAFTGSVPVFEEFPRLIQGFCNAYPLVEMDLKHLSTGEQLQALNNNKIDIGFLRPSLNFRPPPSIDARDLWHDELVLAVAKNHRSADINGKVQLSDMAQEKFILFPQALGCGLFEHITSITAKAGFAPRIIQEVSENSTTLALVAAGLGISIVPSTYADTKPPGVEFKRIDHPEVQSKIILASSRNRTMASLKLFLDYALAF
ncbi:LysR family transcriptional regulator [Alcaligenaceae bacterium]|nr:LysR family transcriptional regulator [Alcaligenaceae bacterium]